jgi:hypothetical protein
MTTERQAEEVRHRYDDAYSAARSIVATGDIIKVLGIVAGVLVAVVGFVLRTKFGVGAVVGSVILGAMAGSVIYGFGLLIAAQGQVLYAALDTAVHTSPLMTVEHKAAIISAATVAGPSAVAGDAGI